MLLQTWESIVIDRGDH